MFAVRKAVLKTVLLVMSMFTGTAAATTSAPDKIDLTQDDDDGDDKRSAKHRRLFSPTKSKRAGGQVATGTTTSARNLTTYSASDAALAAALGVAGPSAKQSLTEWLTEHVPDLLDNATGQQEDELAEDYPMRRLSTQFVNPCSPSKSHSGDAGAGPSGNSNGGASSPPAAQTIPGSNTSSVPSPIAGWGFEAAFAGAAAYAAVGGRAGLASVQGSKPQYTAEEDTIIRNHLNILKKGNKQLGKVERLELVEKLSNRTWESIRGRCARLADLKDLYHTVTVPRKPTNTASRAAASATRRPLKGPMQLVDARRLAPVVLKHGDKIIHLPERHVQLYANYFRCDCGGSLSVKTTSAVHKEMFRLPNPWMLGCSRYNGGAGCKNKYMPEELQVAVDKAA